ncbi:hypothetical protein HYT56_00750 [Candidatus Woesearchaeota archaeon]|nr:hypothetical protein [Candidatus Woesearchaeota archaeon]
MIAALNYNEIVSKLKEKGLDGKEIDEKINKKMDQLSGLISKEGAAHIIANELGIKIFEDIGEIKIEKVRSGMRNVNINGKLTINFGIRSFKNEKREGRVGSFVIGDETGTIRVVLWDDTHLNKMEGMKEESIVRVENGYIRENNGYKEIHLNNNSKFELNPDGVKIENVKANGSLNLNFNEKKIKELNVGDRASIKGTIVQVFDPRFYEVCGQCGKRLIVENGSFNCAQHGKVNPMYSCVVNCVLDDGTESVRVVCFRELAANLLGIPNNDLIRMKDLPGEFEKIKENLLGKQIKADGRANRNEMFDRIEFIAAAVEELNPEKLLEEMNDI